MLQDPKTIELKNKYKEKLKRFTQDNALMITFGSVGVAMALFYIAGYKNGKLVGQAMEMHGPCMEIPLDVIDALDDGKFLLMKFGGVDKLLYKLLDADPTS
jgi:hypothetical protein